jgi:hypothetical protein
MNYKSVAHRITELSFILLCGAISLTCNEALPTYVFPQNVMSLKVSLVEQLNDKIAPPDHQMVHFVLEGKNTFDEVFQDSVDIRGSMRIWWKRKPQRFRTVYLTKSNLTNPSLIQNGKMMLLPGQGFSMNVFWNLKTDDSLYLPYEMNFAFYTQRHCGLNVSCADPEDFVVEVSLNVFDRLGYIIAPSIEYTFVARECNICGYPPCPPPAGGCG